MCEGHLRWMSLVIKTQGQVTANRTMNSTEYFKEGSVQSGIDFECLCIFRNTNIFVGMCAFFGSFLL